MSKIYYICPIPYIYRKNSESYILDTEWESIEQSETYDLPYPSYGNYKKRLSVDGKDLLAIIRLFEDSAIFIINHLNPKNEEDIFNNGDDGENIIKELIEKSGLHGMGYSNPILLKIYADWELIPYEKESFCYLPSALMKTSSLTHAIDLNYWLLAVTTPNGLENADLIEFFSDSSNFDNKIVCVSRFRYNLKINFNSHLSAMIIDNIITLIAVSELAFYFSIRFLDADPTEFDRIKIIKFFWGHKSLFLRCPAIQMFPLFFNQKLHNINNLLDCRSMDLIENQNNRLDDIHKVEGGILVLTLVLVFEILNRFFSLKEFNLGLNPVLSISLSIIMTLILLEMQKPKYKQIYDKYLNNGDGD